MFGRFEKTTADWPKTTPINGGAGVHITGKYLPPAFIQWVQSIYGLGAVIAIFAITGESGPDNAVAAFIISIVGSVVVYKYAWIPLLTNLVGKSVDIKILPDSILVKQLFSYKEYSRAMPIEFRIDQHQKARAEEAREIERGKKQSRTYRQAVEVVMQYGENRVVLAELPDKEMEKAKALVMRIGALNDSFHGRAENEALAEKMDQYIAAAPASSGDFGPSPEIR